MQEKNSKYIISAAEARKNEYTFSHPLNPKSLMLGTQLSKLAGLSRTGVNLVRVPPEKEAFVYHSHQREEEWIYIISGLGIVEINDEKHQVVPGDFLGFPTPSVAHHISNMDDVDLVYLMGGENLDVEIVDFPRLGKHLIKRDDVLQIYSDCEKQDF